MASRKKESITNGQMEDAGESDEEVRRPEENPYELYNKIRRRPEDFPSPALLQQKQREYREKQVAPRRTKTGLPVPHPSLSDKDEVFQLDDYYELDDYACRADPELRTENFEDLMDYLMPRCKTNIEKTRIIFRWIAAQNLDEIERGFEPTKGSPLEYLYKIRADILDYTDLMYEMCKFAKVPCRKLTGMVKGASYHPGESMVDQHKGSWLAVYIENSWRFVDAHWGSRHVVGGIPGQWRLVDNSAVTDQPVEQEPSMLYEPDEFYFLANPEYFIYSHLPDDPKWQLLSRVVTPKEFEEMAYLKPAFFDLGLNVRSHRHCIIEAVNGEIEIRVGLPRRGKRRFVYKIWRYYGDEEQDSVGKVELERYVYVENIKRELTAQISFPVSGRYKFEIMGRDCDEEVIGFFYQLCVYIISVDKPKENCKPMPPNLRSEWGPGVETEELGMKPKTHPTGTIVTENGEVEIRFKLDHPGLEFLHHLETAERSHEELANYAVHRIEKDEVIFNIKCPEADDYTFSIFAKDEGHDGELENICNYLIKAKKGCEDKAPYPSIPHGRLGLTTDGKQLLLTPLSHKQTVIHANDAGDLIVELGTQCPIDFLGQLKVIGPDGEEEDFSKYLITEQEDGKARLIMSFPRPGQFRLGIYAKERGKEGGMPNVLNYIVNVDMPNVECFPKPKAHASWGPGFKLICPKDGFLPAFTEMPFLLIAPHVEEICVVKAHSEWVELERGADGQWFGTVNTGPGNRTLRINACFEPGKDFNTLLEYRVLTDQDLEEFERQRRQMLERFIKENPEIQRRLDEAELKRKLGLKEFLLMKARLAEEEAWKAWKKRLEQRKELVDPKLDPDKRIRLERIIREEKRRELLSLMQAAMAKEDVEHLRKLTEEFEHKRFDDDEHGTFRQACEKIKFLECLINLKEAIDRCQYYDLKYAIKAVEDNNFEPMMPPMLMARARKLLIPLERIETLRHAILTMDNKLMSEIRSYREPPVAVHTVMVASLLLLGQHEGRTRNWKNCQKLCGNTGPFGIFRRVRDFELKRLHPEIAARAREVLKDLDLDEVRDKSSGAAAFFNWAMGMVQEREKNFTVPHIPANKRRQKEIFEEIGYDEDMRVLQDEPRDEDTKNLAFKKRQRIKEDQLVLFARNFVNLEREQTSVSRPKTNASVRTAGFRREQTFAGVEPVRREKTFAGSVADKQFANRGARSRSRNRRTPSRNHRVSGIS